MDQKRFTRLLAYAIKSIRLMFNAEMLICHSKASLDGKFYLVKSHIFKTQQLENANQVFVWESGNPHSILVYDLCSIEVQIQCHC